MRNFIFDQFNSPILFPSPLSIWNFAAFSKNIKEFDEIEKELSSTPNEFLSDYSKIFENLSSERQIIFCLISIAEWNAIVLEAKYDHLCSKINISNPLDFTKLIEMLEGQYLIIYKEDNVSYVKFIHPIFHESFLFSFFRSNSVKNGYKEMIVKIFTMMLDSDYSLSFDPHDIDSEWDDFDDYQDETNASLVNEKKISDLDLHFSNEPIIDFIVNNYNILPNKIQLILFSLSEKENSAGMVGKCLSNHFSELPEELVKLTKKILTGNIWPWGPIEYLIAQINYIPGDFQNIILDLSKQEEFYVDISYSFSPYFDNISEVLQTKLIHNLIDNDRRDQYILHAINYHFDKFSLSRKKEIISHIKSYPELIDLIKNGNINPHDNQKLKDYLLLVDGAI
ncbi:hypothetical protein [Candidatus Lokiarchaeum ossiferum]